MNAVFRNRPNSTKLVRRLIGLWLGMVLAAMCFAEDTIELRSGITLTGKVVSIGSDSVTVSIQAGTRQLSRKFPLSRVRAVTIDGKRQTFDTVKPKSNTPPTESTPDAPAPLTSAGLIQRSPEEITQLIQRLGRTPPSWFEKSTLDYPETLDLTWPDTPPPTWNYTRHIEHYIWDIINSNRNRYANGIRFMHHLLQVNQERPSVLPKIMNELGRMYFEFYNDYARAAFWWENANVSGHDKFQRTDSPARLAECYWHLGNRQLAESTLRSIPLTLGVIKLWGDLKETQLAVELAEKALSDGLEASEVYLLAGDALRTAEQYDPAITYYRKALDLEIAGPHREQIERNQRRAQGTIELIELFDKLDFRQVADGTYADKSYGYAGNVELETIVDQGRLNEIKITSLSDKQYFHAVDATMKKIIKQQSVKGIDAVSGATVTSEAVIRATAKAMAQGSQ